MDDVLRDSAMSTLLVVVLLKAMPNKPTRAKWVLYSQSPSVASRRVRVSVLGF